MSTDEKGESSANAPTSRETELLREIETLRKENRRQKALLARISDLVELGLGEMDCGAGLKH